jgi:putative addiction module CopG family antidote
MQVELSPSLNEFIAAKIKAGDYVDAGEVIRDSLRRWKEQEEHVRGEPAWLEDEILKGIESADEPVVETFWDDLRNELHQEIKGAEPG